MLLKMGAGKLQLEHLTSGLNLRRVGRRIALHDSVDSTNSLAWEYVVSSARTEVRGSPEAENAVDGLVIFAEHQSAGRGRLGRRWDSPRGASVLMSLVLRDPTGDLSGDALSLLAAVAAVDAVGAATAVTAEIRWPNDLVVNGRKLGGILIESRHDERRADGAMERNGATHVVGIGVNCLQHRNHFAPDLQALATSLELECPQPVDRVVLARQLLLELDRWLAYPRDWDAARLREAWVRRALPLGQRVRLRQADEVFSGQVLDIDPAAGLVVQLDDGGRRWFDAASTSLMDHS